jgi:glycosyltransferase involved in cell wall biosynthesis
MKGIFDPVSTSDFGVTIGLPVFNCRDFLEDALKSIFAQTHQKWELIIIDDGSNDGSFELLRSIDDGRIRLFQHRENKGLAYTLNEIVSMASFEFVARMDADDIMHPSRLETQLRCLGSLKDVDLVSTGLYSMRSNGTLVGMRGSSFASISAKDLIQGNKSIVHASILAKKDWHIRNPYRINIKMAEDLDLFICAAEKDDLAIVSIPEKLYVYREDRNISKAKLLTAYRSQREFAISKIEAVPLRIGIKFKSILKSLIVMVVPTRALVALSLKRRNLKPGAKDLIEFNAIYTLVRNTRLPQGK